MLSRKHSDASPLPVSWQSVLGIEHRTHDSISTVQAWLFMLQIGLLRADSVSTVPSAIRGSTAFEMFTLKSALLVFCSCAAVYPDFDSKLGQLSDVFQETGKPTYEHFVLLCIYFTLKDVL